MPLNGYTSIKLHVQLWTGRAGVCTAEVIGSAKEESGLRVLHLRPESLIEDHFCAPTGSQNMLTGLLYECICTFMSQYSSSLYHC